MAGKFQLSERQWYGLVEAPVSAAGFAASPIYVVRIEPLKSGKGFLAIEFLQPLRPKGGQRRRLVMKVVQHSGHHLTGLFEEDGQPRSASVAAADFEWLESYCPTFLARRPVQPVSFTINGMALPDPTPQQHFAMVFGTSELEIERGAVPESFSVHKPDMPERRDTFLVDRELAPFDACLAARGFVPKSQDDKWFIYLAGDKLLFRRSWTGVLIYEVVAQWRGSLLYLGWATVNRDPDQYAETDPAHDRDLLLFLIDALLLGRPTPFPFQVDTAAEGMLPGSSCGDRSASDQAEGSQYEEVEE